MNALAIRELPPLRVAAVEHDGPYLEIGRAFDRLFGILVPRGLVRAQPRLVGIYLNDRPPCPKQSCARAPASSSTMSFRSMPKTSRKLRLKAGSLP